MSRKVALIDMDSILFTAFYGKKVNDPMTGEPKREDGKFVIIEKTDEEIEESLDGIMKMIFETGEFTHYIGFVKGKNTINTRLAIYPEYKQGRPPTPERWEFTKAYAIKAWNAVPIDNIEVDDAIRIASLNIPDSHIVAIDKDLLWLAGTNFNWRKNEWITVTKEQEAKNFAVSMICGDTVDKISGLKGKGDKYCEKNNIETLEGVFKAYLEHYYPSSKAVYEFYRTFTVLNMLEESGHFTVMPTPIKISETDEQETTVSRSASGGLPNTKD